MNSEVVPIKKLGLRQVSMNNSLTTAAHGLTLGEKRVVMGCVAQLGSTNLESSRYKIKITAIDFAETFKVEPQTAYEQLKAVAIKLYERSIKHVTETENGKKITKHRWVSGITYHEGEGWIELGFSTEVTPYLLALSGSYTSYKLEQASALRSIYSWRLLEMLMQFKSTGLLRISIEDFCHAMDAPETYRKNFKNLRNRTIIPAIKELSKKIKMKIDWKPKKAGGRKVTGLEFVFSINTKKKPIG